VSALLYDQLVIQESRGAVPDPEAAAELLAQKALEAGIERFVAVDALEEFLGRLEFAGIDPPDTAQVLRELCAGLRSFAELKSAVENFVSVLERRFVSRPGTPAAGAPRSTFRPLNELAPGSISLGSGRQTKVHYARGKPPWIASRLQDFFGMRETPRIGLKRTPLVVQLLAPNRRPVQTTTDLAGFWERLYPEVRRELMRRYPKHSWPERP
jgi:ATP-dependent helicase HrpB